MGASRGSPTSFSCEGLVRGLEQENGRIPVLPAENDSGPTGVVDRLAGRKLEAPQNW